MTTKLTDNGSLLTLGLVGVVAAVGAANKAGFYGSPAGSGARRTLFGWAKVEDGRVVRLSDAERRPKGDGWGHINTASTKVGDRAYLDGDTVYLEGGSFNEGSAARPVTDAYVESYLDGDNIAISTFLNRHLRGNAKRYAGSYARRMKAALEAMVASGEVYRDTTPNGAASYRRASDEPSGSAARGLRSTHFSVVKATAEESKGMYHPPVVIKVGKDRIVTGAGTDDDLAVFRYGGNLLLVVMNERMPYYGATLYTRDAAHEPWRVDQDVFLQGSEEVEDALGPKWYSLKPATVANRLLAVMS